MKKKIYLVIIILFFIFLVGLFLIYKNNNNEKIILKSDMFIFELGEDIGASASYYLKDADSIKNIKEFSIFSDSLDIKDNQFVKETTDFIPLGEYKITISNKNKERDFIIKVSDTIAPEFTSSKDVIELVEKVENVDLTSYFETKDYSNVKLSIIGEYDMSKVGEYKLKIVAEDESKNFSEKDFTLKINAEEEPVVIPQEKPNNSENTSSNGSTKNDLTENNSTVQTPTLSSGYRKDIANSYVNQINSYRKENGLPELPVTNEAQSEADRRSKELVTYYSHDGAGYGFGEIIGHGSVGSDFISGWKNSPSHNATILRVQNTAIAASVYEHNNHWYAVVSFRMNY